MRFCERQGSLGGQFEALDGWKEFYQIKRVGKKIERKKQKEIGNR